MFSRIFERMTKELRAFAPSAMKVYQSECARNGPPHFQLMWISKGGFEPSRRPQEVHCIYTCIFPLLSQFLTLTCNEAALLVSHVHMLKKRKKELGDVDLSESETGTEENMTGKPVAYKTATEKPCASSESDCQGGPKAVKDGMVTQSTRVSSHNSSYGSSILDRQEDLRTRT